MTTMQMNAEILRNMSIIAEDEHLLKRAAKYLRKLAAEKQDPTLYTKEEFFARVDKAKKVLLWNLQVLRNLTNISGNYDL